MSELPEITNEDRQFLHYNPNTDDIVEFVQSYALRAIASMKTKDEQSAATVTVTSAQIEAIRYARRVMASDSYESRDSQEAKAVLDALLSSASQPKEKDKLERIRQLAECGVSHGLLADDYCQQILDVIASQPAQSVDERAEFEKRFGSKYHKHVKDAAWDGWQARAALNGGNHG